MLRSSLRHPDLSAVLNGALDQGIKLAEHDGEVHMFIPGTFDRELAEQLEETIWERLHFASHLRTDRLGEFTIGTELHRSESLALIQLLILYHLFTATASVALGGEGTREPEAEAEKPSRASPGAGGRLGCRSVAARRLVPAAGRAGVARPPSARSRARSRAGRRAARTSSQSRRYSPSAVVPARGRRARACASSKPAGAGWA